MAHSKKHLDKVFLATHFSTKYKDEEIPDPYFGGEKGFELLWDRVEDSCKSIFTHFLLILLPDYLIISAMKLLLSKPRGFCAGVVRAIETVERALQAWGAPIYVKHQIVHNRHVVEDLEKKGLSLLKT